MNQRGQSHRALHPVSAVCLFSLWADYLRLFATVMGSWIAHLPSDLIFNNIHYIKRIKTDILPTNYNDGKAETRITAWFLFHCKIGYIFSLFQWDAVYWISVGCQPCIGVWDNEMKALFLTQVSLNWWLLLKLELPKRASMLPYIYFYVL